VTLADERARQQENTNFDLNRRASLRPYLEYLDGDGKGKDAMGGGGEKIVSIVADVNRWSPLNANAE
jgi:hypothetical protein